MLFKKCDKSPSHAPCAGANTVVMQGYADELKTVLDQCDQHKIGTETLIKGLS